MRTAINRILRKIRPGFLSGLISLSFIPNSTVAQWKKIFQGPLNGIYSTFYFLNLPGTPRIGFNANYKTTDGGMHWLALPISPIDFTFKDSLTGWYASKNGIYKTTDGGDTWSEVPGVYEQDVYGIYYDTLTHGLFASVFSRNPNWVSWDEGATWSTFQVNSGVGFAFNDDTLGFVASSGGQAWLRTTDGGHTWQSIAMDSECWQPLAINRTKTGFAITDIGATICRTDDAWDTWKILYQFPPEPDQWGASTNGCIAGDLNHLFIQMRSGCYLSTDQGLSWKYLCGQPNIDNPYEDFYDRRFYAKGPYVYITTVDTANHGYDAWMVNVDSMQYFPSGIMFSDSTKRISLIAGAPVTINSSPETSDS